MVVSVVNTRCYSSGFDDLLAAFANGVVVKTIVVVVVMSFVFVVVVMVVVIVCSTWLDRQCVCVCVAGVRYSGSGVDRTPLVC